MIKIAASKRLRFSIAVIIVNFLIGGFGIYHVADLSDLGMFLALSNSPLYVYILGDTVRPSNNKKHEI